MLENEWMVAPADLTAQHGIVALGGDLEPNSLLAAYRTGVFPMPLLPSGVLGWWSPDPRAILPLDRFRPSRSLRRSVRGFRSTFDQDFGQVVEGCAVPSRPGSWITDEMAQAYKRLHDLGWAHSVEVWQDDRLVGGLYGISIGRFFAGESMFHLVRDASKVALVRLVEIMSELEGALVDVQWLTPHLASLGAVEVARSVYLQMLARALEAPGPWPDGSGSVGRGEAVDWDRMSRTPGVPGDAHYG